MKKDLQPPNLSPLSSQCQQIEVADVIKALRLINLKKSTGPDNIPGRVLKLAAHSLGEPLCDLFNSCLEQGQFPSTWKKSVIKPIPKSSWASAPKELRQVALTAVVAKVFERLLLRFITPCLTDTQQFAYQPNKSTEDAVAYLLYTATYHLDDNSKNFARCLFIDFTSAFNTISPTILTHLLTDTEQHGNIINLIYSFMINRSQCVVTDVGMSSSRSTSVGSPQGCVLSPVLFSLYIQHMPTPNHGSYHLITYADDTILLELLNNNVPSTLPTAAIELVDWFQSNELVLNVGKTKELIFSNARDNPTCDNLIINGTSVEQVESFT